MILGPTHQCTCNPRLHHGWRIGMTAYWLCKYCGGYWRD